MIFATSGSMLPFDRLFQILDRAVESGLITDNIVAQIGEGKYEPKHFEFHRFVEKGKFDQMVSDANLVIGHAGVGVIMQALDAETPLLVLARKAEFGEHVNDHQVSTAQKFEEQGHILSFEEATLAQQLERIAGFTPKARNPNIEGVGARVADFLAELV